MVKQLVGEPGVTYTPTEPGSKRTFGTSALKVRNKIFAMLSGGTLVVKLSRQRVDELVDAGTGDRFDAGKGRPMKEWLAVHPTGKVAWPSLAREAKEFVASQR